MPQFQGFGPETFAFLTGLALNNEKPWFEAHRDDYEKWVVTPALELITALDPVVRAISPQYRGVAKRVGGSLMRVYRDTRFGRDKTPYKTNIGIQFRHVRATDVHAPGWYVHIDPQECFVGAGAWHPEASDLKAIRMAIAARPQGYSDGLAAARPVGLVPVGDSLVRPPVGFDPEHPLISEIRRKDFLLSTPLSGDAVGSPDLIPLLEGVFRASAPSMTFLCAALGAEF